MRRSIVTGLFGSLLMVACSGSDDAPDGASDASSGDASGDATTVGDAGPSDGSPLDAVGDATRDAGTSDSGARDGGNDTGTPPEAGSNDAAPSSKFHAYITPSAYSVVTGGSLTFTATAVDGSGNYIYAWTFPGATPTGAGPHTATFNSTTGDMQPVEVVVTDATTGDIWTQKIFVLVSTTAVNGLSVTMREPASGTATIEQGGTLEIAGTGAQTWSVYSSTVSGNATQGGNQSGDYVAFPFAGTFAPGAVGGSSPLADTGNATATIMVNAEPTGTLGSGMRIGPLMGIRGCYYCNAYDDNRIAVRLSGSHTGKYLAVFDQKMKSVDQDDSIVASIFDGSKWLPFVDVDASRGKGVSPIRLGEGNPEYQHQFEGSMAANGDAVVTFMQAATTVDATRSAATSHVWANVYRNGSWSGSVRLDTEPDNVSNATRDPRVVTWTEAGGVTRALAVWRRHPNYAGLDRLDFSTYSSATGTWTAAATVTGSASNTGYYEVRIASTPSGRVFLAWQDAASSTKSIFGSVWENGAWSTAPSNLFTPASDRARMDLAASSNGSAVLVVGNTRGSAANSVHAIRFDGSSWQTATQIGGLSDLDILMPDSLGTGWGYATVADLRVAVDDAGNALAVWLPEAQKNGVGGTPVGVSSYYTAGGAWTAYVPFTSMASDTDFEFVRQESSARADAELGVSLAGGTGIVTYPVASGSRPMGTFHDQLYVRRLTTSSNTWSSRALVDTYAGHTHGHSRVALESNGSATVVYETFPANSLAAGAVYARKITP